MFALFQLTFLEYKGVNQKLLLFLAVSVETELSKLSAILDLSDLSELSAKHELAISKSVVINKFILVNCNHQNVTELISSGELTFYICTPQSEIKVAQHSGDCFSQQSDSQQVAMDICCDCFVYQKYYNYFFDNLPSIFMVKSKKDL